MPDHRNPKVQRQRWFANHIAPWLVLLVLIPLLPVALVVGLGYLTWSAALYACVWLRHPSWVVFVYSDSPKWKDHIEEHILPTLPPGSVVLNWSQRKRWSRLSLAVQTFRRFGGSREFCPIGIIFQRGRRTQQFRFFEPFQLARRGNLSALETLQESFTSAVQAGR